MKSASWNLPFMEEHHRQALATFIGRVTREEPLPGKNKPSWLNDDQENYLIRMPTRMEITGIITVGLTMMLLA